MTNTTVKELIKLLLDMPMDSVVCKMDSSNIETPDDTPDYYSTFETCVSRKSIKYIDDAGDEKIGDIVVID